MGSVVKIGPWGNGSKSAANYDITDAPLRLESITIHQDVVINALAFSYRDSEKLPHTAGPWGGGGGTPKPIELGPSEFVTEIHGAYGLYSSQDAIWNLTFVTNHRTYGPFGQVSTQGCQTFSVPVKNNGSIVGFFALTSGNFVSGLGLYVKPF